MAEQRYVPTPITYAWLRSLVLLAILLMASETFLVLGLVTPIAIHGSSMAPALLGPHVEVRCRHCQWQFAIAAEQYRPQRAVTCPDCRLDFDVEKEPIQKPGERMWVHRLAAPDRWDIVVFRCPKRATDYCIKRVLGMPGEHVDFHRGDLLVNGRVFRKSLAEQRRIRQLVHRERAQAPQWHASDQRWRRSGDEWRHTGVLSGPLSFTLSGRAATDELGVNQTLTRTNNNVTDLAATFDLQFGAGATARCFAEFSDGTVIVSPVISTSGEVEWSLFDRQSILAVDGKVLWSKPHESTWPGPPRLEIDVAGDAVVSDLCVWRDAYYHTRPVDLWPATGVELGVDELFVVGDNVALSEDSRTYRRRGVPRDFVVGVPIGRH